MGIDTHYYTMHGIKLDFNNEFCEAHNEVYRDDDTPFVLFDAMSAEYMILGTVLYDSGNLRWGDLNNSVVEIDIQKLGELELQYRKQFIAKFPQFESLVIEPFKLMTLVHYS